MSMFSVSVPSVYYFIQETPWTILKDHLGRLSTPYESLRSISIIPDEKKVMILEDQTLKDKTIHVPSGNLYLLRCHLQGTIDITRDQESSEVICLNCTYIQGDQPLLGSCKNLTWVSLLGHPPCSDLPHFLSIRLMDSRCMFMYCRSITDTNLWKYQHIFLKTKLISNVQCDEKATIYLHQDEKTTVKDTKATIKVLNEWEWNVFLTEFTIAVNELLWREPKIRKLRAKYKSLII